MFRNALHRVLVIAWIHLSVDDSALGNEFERIELPDVIQSECLKCHGPLKQKAGVDLRSLARLLAGGDNGALINPQEPESSRILQVLAEDADPHMPPKKSLPIDAIESIQTWVLSVSQRIQEHGDAWRAAPNDATTATQEPQWTPPHSGAPSAIIDAFVERRFESFAVEEPTALCDDQQFLRRAYLDLAGRIPTLKEQTEFLSDNRPNARERLVDRLLNGSDYPRQMREIFNVALMSRRGDQARNRRAEAGWTEYLESIFRENRPWNEFIHEIIEARASQPDERPSAWFLYERKDDHQAMAEAIAPWIYGTRIDCAQCHDHPLAEEIKQGHYWGLVTAFNRSKNVNSKRGPALAESAVGGFVGFTNLEKETSQATLKFLNGVEIPEPRPEPNEKWEDRPDLYLVPPNQAEETKDVTTPKFSRRAALANAVTEDNPLLAKAMINRVWKTLMGRGLVHPTEEINSAHPPSHPGLLDWLAAQFLERNHDVKWLVRTIALTETYQRSRPKNLNPNQDPSAFAYAIEKPLTAETLTRSLLIALGQPADGPLAIAPDAFHDLFNNLVEVFPEVFPDVYNADLAQAMYLTNAPEFDRFIEDQTQTLSESAWSQLDDTARIEDLFQRLLVRSPTSEERQRIRDYLSTDRESAPDKIQDVVWALVSGAEFQLNY